MKKFAILVAGGQGSRMGNELPKQFLPLNGKPILQHTLEKFAGLVDEIVVVLPASHISYWEQQCTTCEKPVSHRVVEGGKTRSASVINGLNALNEEGLVAIHDAVRPLVSRELIEKIYSEAAKHGCAIPVTPVRESLRIKQSDTSIPVDREQYLAVQTPQCFIKSKLVGAYQVAKGQSFTDDATVFGNAGFPIHTIEGEHSNIKITFREDLVLAGVLSV